MASSSGKDKSYGATISRSVRPAIDRTTSVIIPSTGARISNTNEHRRALRRIDENEPLLGRNDGNPQSDNGTARRRSFGKTCDRIWAFAQTRPAKMSIKCSLAYLIGSLATFVAPIAGLLGQYEGKHLVATFCVYFHPVIVARTYGSMFQATLYALIAFAYSTLVSMGSMGTSVLFAKLDLVPIGHALVLIVFCGGGLGLIGYVKLVKSHPTVSVACSLSSICIITILVKEGDVQRSEFEMGKVAQVSLILAMSIIISNVLAFLIWPSSAIHGLRQLMVECNDSFSDSLTRITQSFLTGSDEEIQSSKFVAAAENRRTVFGSLMKLLKDAKYEHYIWGTEQEHYQEKLLVESMQRLSQNIGGLRSAALTQFELIQQIQRSSGLSQPIPTSLVHRETAHLFTPPEGKSYLSTSPKTDESSSTDVSSSSSDAGDEPLNPLTIFQELVNHLGDPMESLVFTLTEMLDELPFGPAPAYRVEINQHFDESLAKAIEMYSTKRAEALDALYHSEYVTKSRSLDEDADVAEMIAASGYFSFNLQYFAGEMSTFLNILDELQRLQEQKPRTWEWIKFWKRSEKKVDEEISEPPVQRHREFLAPQRRRTIPNLSPEAVVPVSYKLWKALHVFRSDHVKFTIKVGTGAALFALPAFVPATRATFQLWRGEWGLVSYMIIISMTLGQTNNSGEARIIGTVIGAVLALIAWAAFPHNPYALALYGWVVCLPCFWIILTWKQATFGRFILLTYNLSALYAYSLSTHEEYGDDEGGMDPLITEIALHRFVAVTVGVVWGIFINRMIWPISARLQLRKGLSVLWLKMAMIWSQDPLEVLVKDNDSINQAETRRYRTIADEHTLQQDLVVLNSVAAAAPHEFRLKGPFPVKEYQQIQKANQGVLDAFHGLSVMIMQDPKANSREAEILEYTRKERHNLCTRISHLFYVLGSSIRIGFPLPETLPNTVSSRDRLLARLFDYRKSMKGKAGEVDEDFALIYAYALVTARVSEGLEELIKTMGLLYGTLEDEMLEV